MALEVKNFFSYRYISPILISVIVFLWVFWLSDNSVNFSLSLILGVCCGIVSHFVLNNERSLLLRGIPWFSAKKLLVISFAVLLTSFITNPTGIVYQENWFSLSALNWASYLSTLLFSSFIPGFIILKIVDKHNQLNKPSLFVLSALLSIYFTTLFFFVFSLISKSLLLPNYLGHILFVFSQFLLIVVYFLRFKSSSKIAIAESRRSLNISLVLALIAVVVISVSFVVLELFVFIRGDSWSYINTAIAFNKVGFSVPPTGQFYNLVVPNFFEIYNSSVFGMSGFPPINNIMLVGLVIALLLPIAFYVMCLEYSKSRKVALLSTFVHIIASGFGWLLFVAQNLSPSTLPNISETISNLIPATMSDLTQPQGVISEGIKTYSVALLAIIMILFLFKSSLRPKLRLALISVLVAFSFQFHIEEALIFILAFVPAFVFLFYQNKSQVRVNILGVVVGLTFGLLVNLISSQGKVTVDSVFYGVVSLIALGLFLTSTFVKADKVVVSIKNFLKSYRKIVFLVVCYVLVVCSFVLVFYGNNIMTSDYVSQVVSSGFVFPWYYYPLSLGIAGILAVTGIWMKFEKSDGIVYFLVAIPFIIVFGIIISYINVNFFYTGAREWRIIYRILPIATSAFAGWVLYRLITFFQTAHKSFKFNFLKVNPKYVPAVILILVIVLGIPSTVIASEYWMSTELNSYKSYVIPEAPDLFLMNYLYQNVTPVERVAVLNPQTNAIVRLSGATTAFSPMYPEFLNTRPETTALISSDVHYICLNTTIENVSNYSILKFLPIVYKTPNAIDGNSSYTLYRIPFLQPSSFSSVGYVAPDYYSDDTLLSYMLISSLNSSYEIIRDDTFDKSVIILPSANQSQAKSSFDLGNLLNWVNSGGQLVVFGGYGEISELLNYREINGPAYPANEITIGSKTYSLDIENLTLQSVVYGNDVNVLSYYSANGSEVSPFVLEKVLGEGKLVYVNTNPLVNQINTSRDNSHLWSGNVVSSLRSSLEKAGLHLDFGSIGIGRSPVGNRWIGKYTTYGQIEFSSTGDINSASTFSGSYLLKKPTNVTKISFMKDDTPVVIDSISVEGNSIVNIHSNNLTSAYLNSSEAIPNYPLMHFFGNSTVNITLTNGSFANILIGNRTFTVDGSIEFEAESIYLAQKQPCISVNGETIFHGFLSITDSQTGDIVIPGPLNFNISYADSQYFFSDSFSYERVITSTYPSQVIEQSRHLEKHWEDLIFSIILSFIILFSVILFVFRKRLQGIINVNLNRKK